MSAEVAERRLVGGNRLKVGNYKYGGSFSHFVADGDYTYAASVSYFAYVSLNG